MSKEEKRVGVFICHCGKNIAGGVDINALLEHARQLEGVVVAQDNRFSCSEEGQTLIQDAVRQHNLNRIVVAACDPALHLATFQRCGEQVGVNPAFTELVDIRKWTMPGSPQKVDPELALENSKRLIAQTVKRIRLKKIVPQVEVKVEPSVLVIGGGIAGVEAALDLAEKGYKVHLVERLPTIGGKMALLYKVFPTNDCAPCILAPKTAYANMHPNITLLTNSEVTSVQGHVGNFKVRILKHPRFVDEKKCTGCALCVEKCPAKAPDSEFSAGMGQRKAIYIPFPQAIPRKATIDKGACLYFQKGVCKVCEKFCPTGAVDFEQKPENIELRVGAVIVATGFEEYDPSAKKEYGYGQYRNVITQLQLARILDIDGPTKGKLLRPSDGREPKNILMIQCVGSREEKSNVYCSSVCCMYALKHAQIIKEMVLPNAEICIAYTDMRTPGKGFEEYYRRTRDLDVTFLRGKPSQIIENPETQNLMVIVEDTLIGQPVTVDADLVVLSCAMVPSKGTKQLAELLRIETDKDGWLKEAHPKLKPVETNIRGIYICGCAQGPKDIPDAIVQAKAAASCADSELRKGKIMLPEFVVKAAE
ncbi:MAG: FAD-dependent oxidoreductase [Candidatus Bathyarchaeia archaeon]